MSALVYDEPYKFPAVLLTLAMHAIFFTVLYLGVNWQVKQPEGMEVELWGELPESTIPPPPTAHAAETPPLKHMQEKPSENLAPPAKPDIALREKKKSEASKPKKAAKKEPKKKPLTKVQQKQLKEDLQAADEGATMATSAEQAVNNAKAAQQAQARAAITSEVEKYKTLIRSKIRDNIVMPPDVPDDAQVIFVITLLPDGSVMDDVKRVKSSGIAAYDDAVERAIRKTNTLPLPQDEAARAWFINPNHLELKFSPKNGE